jgi:hypothetical protein
MVALHAQIIEKNGKKEYAILPYEEFQKVQEALDEFEDLRCLREANEAEKDAPTIGMAELKEKLRRRAKQSGVERSRPRGFLPVQETAAYLSLATTDR